MSYKTLYLHIGLVKTGTTWIQDFCVRNEPLLLDQGVLYPRSGRSTVDKVDIAHHDIAAGASSLNEAPRWMKLSQARYLDNITQLNNEISRSQASKVVLSSEHFSWTQCHDSIDKFMASISENFKAVKVVLFLRPWDDWAMSVGNQWVKEEHWNTSLSSLFSDICRFLTIQFQSLKAIQEYFGKDNIIVSYFSRNLISDFFQAIDVDIGEVQSSFFPFRNKSFPQELLALSLRINRAFPKERWLIDGSYNAAHPDAAFLVHRLQPILQKIAGDEFSTRPIFTPQQRIEIYERCDELGGDLFHELLGRRKCFPDPSLCSDKNWQSPEELDCKGLLDVLAALVLDYVDCRASVDSLLKENHFLSERVKRIEKNFFKKVINFNRLILGKVFKSV